MDDARPRLGLGLLTVRYIFQGQNRCLRGTGSGVCRRRSFYAAGFNDETQNGEHNAHRFVV